MNDDSERHRSDGPGLYGLLGLFRRMWVRLAIAVATIVVLGVSYGLPVPAAIAACVVIAGIILVPIGPAATTAPLPVAAPPIAADEHTAFPAEGVIESFPDPVAVIDSQGLLLLANEEFRGTFGTAPVGSSFLMRFRTPEIQEAVQAAISGEKAVPVEYEERSSVERWFRVSITPVGSADRRTQWYIIHFRDLSESRRIDRMRADFVANASHELRTPLAALSGFIETLAGPARDDVAARERFLGIMQEQASRMSRLIDDLLSLSRLEMRLGKAGFSALDLKPLVWETVDALQPMARDVGVEIAVNATPSSPVVRGSRDELIQVVENLIENALKYAPEGKRVDVLLRDADISGVPAVAIEVRDYGPGIPEEHIPRLTERFYRVSIEASRARRGTGLGLAIVKHIVARHDGRLTISSRVGEGSTFTVTLPVQAASKGNGTLEKQSITTT